MDHASNAAVGRIHNGENGKGQAGLSVVMALTCQCQERIRPVPPGEEALSWPNGSSYSRLESRTVAGFEGGPPAILSIQFQL